MARNSETEVEHDLEESLSTSSAGRWLFKDKGLLMGPVPASVIIDKLYAGEIDADTSVASETNDEKWKPLGKVSLFSVHVAKAQARHKVLREKKEHEARVRRKKATRLTVTIVSGGALVIAVFAVVAWLVSTQPWREEDAALADLEITVNPPTIALASAEDLQRGQELFLDVDVDVEEARDEPRPTKRPQRRPRRQPSAKQAKSAPAEAGVQQATKTTTVRDSDGLGTTRSYDMDHIRSVLGRETRSLRPCVAEEVRRSGFSGTIPFTIVINNDGRVGRLWIDERRLRGGEMQRCFERTMQGWRFRAFSGERPNVSQSITVGRR